MKDFKDIIIDILASKLVGEYILKNDCCGCPFFVDENSNCKFYCYDPDHWKNWANSEAVKICTRPKKPIKKIIDSHIKKTIYECPVCGGFVFEGHDDKCVRCGQLIDWSKGE